MSESVPSSRAISESIQADMRSASWIRQMFEEGRRLKEVHGEDNVFDFSLGNPSAAPPAEFRAALEAVAQESGPQDHRYIPNTGRPDVRERMAELSSRFHGMTIPAEAIVMTSGAAGALNIFFKSVLERDDEVILLAPYFPEYDFYVRNHGGRKVVVATGADLRPDPDRIAAAFTDRTRAVILNTPSNPSGVCFGQSHVDEIARRIDAQAEKVNRPVYLVMDEPYRRINYTSKPHPSVFQSTRHGVVATSFSKDLGLAGERIGFLALHPDLPERDVVERALSVATRTLGFVNASSFMQRVIARCADSSVDVEEYRRKRDMLYGGLRDAGYVMPEPEGAFFLFPEVPNGDDVAFCDVLRQRLVLTVPGSGFGTPGHIRISYAVDDDIIRRAVPLFAEVLDDVAKSNRRH